MFLLFFFGFQCKYITFCHKYFAKRCFYSSFFVAGVDETGGGWYIIARGFCKGLQDVCVRFYLDYFQKDLPYTRVFQTSRENSSDFSCELDKLLMRTLATSRVKFWLNSGRHVCDHVI